MAVVQEDARIVDHQKIALQTYLLRLNAPAIASRAKAGQFVMLKVSDGIDPLLRRPFSFHRIRPKEGIVEILYRVVGRGTWKLAKCPVGSSINLIGPLGNRFEMPESDDGLILFVAGGIGIAPLVQLMADIAASSFGRSPGSRHLFYGARSHGELLPSEWFADLAVQIHWCTDDGSFGTQGVVTDLLERNLAEEDLSRSVLYSCGPLAMQYHVAKWAQRTGIKTQMSLESLMACGLGACLGCALPGNVGDGSGGHYVHVCKDGPIFAPGRVRWDRIQTHRQIPQTFLYS